MRIGLARALAALFGVVAFGGPAMAATPQDVFECNATYSDSLAARTQLTSFDTRQGSTDDYDWESVYYYPPTYLTVFGYAPSRLEYYFSDDGFGGSDGFVSRVSAPFAAVQNAVFSRLGLSACARWNNGICVIDHNDGTIEIEPIDANVTEIGCWWDG